MTESASVTRSTVGAAARRGSVRAPELRGRGWLNTGGTDLTLAGLRGRIVLLDFWTFCCVNCLHVLDELRPLEEKYADVLVTIGVHSPKFVHEADPEALAAAVERYAVHHPVLDDPALLTWDAYAARAWPTLVVVDPLGRVVAHLSGEGHAHGLGVLIEELIAEHEAAGTLRRGEGPYVPAPEPASRLRFPGKVIALPGGTLLVSDTAHHQLVELETDLVTERRRFGTGERGLVDGAGQVDGLVDDGLVDGGLVDGAGARFAQPQGVLLLPAEVAAKAGYDVLVADSANHALRGLRLADGLVSTVAGTGEQLRTRVPVGAGSELLSTPWDLAWWDDVAVVAMAGSHQLWAFDPLGGGAPARALAGTTGEGLWDGPGAEASFAQPSGLAVDTEGTLWVADSETSAVRTVRREGPGSRDDGQDAGHPDSDGRTDGGIAGVVVGTATGQGLFHFGFRDGDALTEALLQHPLGVAVLPDGSVAIADTYNGAVRRYDPVLRTVSTLARDLREPSDLMVDGVNGTELIVVESAAHRLLRLPIPGAARIAAERVDAGAHQVRRARTDLAAGELSLVIEFSPPTGQHLDDRFGDPTSLTVTASPPDLLAEGTGTAPGLTRTLNLAGEPGTEGVLQISVAAAACDDADAEFGACHRYQQDWGIPVRLVAGAPGELVLHLRAV